MIEVFKTDIIQPSDAQLLINLIAHSFEGHVANFDLEDNDHILRVLVSMGIVESAGIIQLLNSKGFIASILPDDICYAPDKAENRKYESFI